MNHQAIRDDTNLRFYLLNGDVLITETFVSVPNLKISYPDLWKKAQGILETFINLCLDKWAEDYPVDGWNVGTFDVLLGD